MQVAQVLGLSGADAGSIRMVIGASDPANNQTGKAKVSFVAQPLEGLAM